MNPVRFLVSGNVLVAGLLMAGGVWLRPEASPAPATASVAAPAPAPAEPAPPPMTGVVDPEPAERPVPPPMEYATEPTREFTVSTETGLGFINLFVRETP